MFMGLLIWASHFWRPYHYGHVWSEGGKAWALKKMPAQYALNWAVNWYQQEPTVGKGEKKHMYGKRFRYHTMEIAILKRGAIKITNSTQEMKLLKNKYHGFVITI